MPHPDQRRSPRAALTLIDLIVTMLVIGVMGAVAAPRFSAMMNHYRVSAAAGRLQADLEYARRQAQTQGRPQSVVFDGSANRYELPDSPHPDRPGTKYVVELSSAAAGVALKSAAFESGASAVTYDLYGRPDAAGAVVLAAGVEQRTIRVDGTSGRVTVE
ncbi:MAG TPA: GspH/FimT family pseudopilin [Planctomycetaceae bacterium]|nr:GspH/FimT family pseudopilin [Planctomycetaceae bacterium]